MQVTLEKVTAHDALAMIDLISDDPDVRSCARESGDDPNAFGVVEVSIVLAVVVAAGAGARFIVETVYKIRQRFRPFIVVDCSGPEPRVHVVEDVPGMRGEVVVKFRDGEEVRLEKTAESAEIAKTVLGALS